MPIEFACPDCGRQFRAKDEDAGKRMKCAGCGQSFRVPGPAEAPGVAADPGPPNPAGVASRRPVGRADSALGPLGRFLAEGERVVLRLALYWLVAAGFVGIPARRATDLSERNTNELAGLVVASVAVAGLAIVSRMPARK